jgi:hypothetical protein
MTIAAAWVRTLKDCKELIVVSDSRLNGGKKMDCGQKVIGLPRSDAFICFAGNTQWAYPLVHQVANAISTYEKSASRAQDIVELKTHVLKLFEDLRRDVHDAYGDEGVPSAEFLFGGYSWIRKKFMIWRVHFHIPRSRTKLERNSKAAISHAQKNGRFQASPAKEWREQPWVFAGDEEYVKKARLDLGKMMRSRKSSPDQVKEFKFNWEPFEVIRDMLRDADANPSAYRTGNIGGAPQVLKVYEHLSSRYLAVEWRSPSSKRPSGVYICGRRLLGYETPTLWILDPDTLRTRHTYYSQAAVRAGDQTESTDEHEP